MNYENIVSLINEKIRENEQGFITGEVLNLVLRSIVETTGAQEGLMGVATPDTMPSEEPDSKQYWFAVEAGDYSKFNAEYAGMPAGLWMYHRVFVGDTDEMRWEAVNLGVYLKGKDGYTPIKGVDYFDGKDGYTPIKGVDYFDGKDGKPGRDGVDGKDGEPGRDGVDGGIIYPSYKVDPHNMHLYSDTDSNRVALSKNKHFTVKF